MKIKKLIINKFRHMIKIDIQFNSRITAIAGQNGLGKSSILGLVGHVFDFSGSGNAKFFTLAGKPFQTIYSEIFRFSYPSFDKPKQHDYKLVLDTDTEIPVMSYDRIEKGKEKSLRFRVGKSGAGGGKIQFPIIYLGLRRLFPLAEEEEVNYDLRKKLTDEEKTEYCELHNDILLLDEDVTPQYCKSRSKIFYGVETSKYDSMGNSAGQDNLGQIITALLSFKRLKKQMGKKYLGGLLLIDEVDAVLYPAAQQELMRKLLKYANDLDLQIIFTTHSLDVLGFLSQNEYKFHSSIVYLSNSSGVIKIIQDNLTLGKIMNDLRVIAPKEKKKVKTLVFCEDEEAKFWISNLLGNKITRHIQFIPDSFGCEELVTMANKKIPVFRDTIFVLDGDAGKSFKNNNCPRVVLLPGKESPEKIFYDFLKSLKGDEFWDDFGGYTYQVCFKSRSRKSEDRAVMKSWFKLQKKYLGQRAYSKLFNRWKKDNKQATIKFKEEFIEILSKITGEKYD